MTAIAPTITTAPTQAGLTARSPWARAERRDDRRARHAARTRGERRTQRRIAAEMRAARYGAY